MTKGDSGKKTPPSLPSPHGLGVWFGKGAVSAGILPYRKRGRGELEVFLVHPGGPFFARKDAGVWTIPKGQVEKGEDPLETALREFREETGFPPPDPNNLVYLGEVVYPTTRKRVLVWAAQMPHLDPKKLRSNMVHTTLRGKPASWPEVDRGEWFPISTAREKIFPPLIPLLDTLTERVSKD